MLRKSLFIPIFGLLTDGHLRAQWNQVNLLSTNNNLRDTIFPINYQGYLENTTNGGLSWDRNTRIGTTSHFLSRGPSRTI